MTTLLLIAAEVDRELTAEERAHVPERVRVTGGLGVDVLAVEPVTPEVLWRILSSAEQDLSGKPDDPTTDAARLDTEARDALQEFGSQVLDHGVTD